MARVSGSNFVEIKMEAGKIELEAVDFSVPEVVEDSAKSLRWAAAAKSLDIVLNVDARLQGVFRGDAGRIGQVLNNLISNPR